MQARRGGEEAARVVDVVLGRIVLALDVVGPDILAVIGMVVGFDQLDPVEL